MATINKNNTTAKLNVRISVSICFYADTQANMMVQRSKNPREKILLLLEINFPTERGRHVIFQKPARN